MDLDRVAERFDAVYSELTLLQRRLIAARRDPLSPRDEWELLERARVMIAAFTTAEGALEIGAPSVAEMEAAALAARVLQRPVDDHLLLAAMRSQGRSYAYPLLAAALRMSATETPAGLAGRQVIELLGASRSFGAHTARDLAKHWGVSPGRAGWRLRRRPAWRALRPYR
jgi:hypothetical protein